MSCVILVRIRSFKNVDIFDVLTEHMLMLCGLEVDDDHGKANGEWYAYYWLYVASFVTDTVYVVVEQLYWGNETTDDDQTSLYNTVYDSASCVTVVAWSLIHSLLRWIRAC